MSVPKQLGSPPGYNTLGRPSSLPISKANYQRSTSNPNLSGITPTSPDSEVLSFIGMLHGLDLHQYILYMAFKMNFRYMTDTHHCFKSGNVAKIEGSQIT